MKKYLYLIFASFLFIISCTEMDYKYKEFLEGGPITYLGKLKESEVRVIGERNRVQFVIPKQADPRGTKVEIFWANKTEHKIQPIDPSTENVFYVEDLTEASYIFEISVLDDKGNYSIPISLSATAYGNLWESYIANRLIVSTSRSDGNLAVSYDSNIDKRLLGTEFIWKSSDETYTAFVDSSQTTGILEDFKTMSFKYRSRYIPEEGGVDMFYSPWDYYVENISPDQVVFEKTEMKFTMPVLADDYWTGYEFVWNDAVTGELRVQTTRSNTIILEGYNASLLRYSALYDFDGVLIASGDSEFSTNIYEDLDRSQWYIAPEIRKSDGSPINNVSQVQVSEKYKSPYLSHLLFYAASGSDGQIRPANLFDGDDNSYLSMIKGFGTTYLTNRNKSGTKHAFGGVESDGNDIYFVIDLGSEQIFNYFRIAYRPGQANGNLKPQAITVYGSNDVDAVNNNALWTEIKSGITLPGSSLASTSSNPDDPGRNTGNVIIPDNNYRYVKVRFDAWTDASNSMAVSEFYLGRYY